MPIAVCGSEGELIEWCREFVEAGKYRVISTEENEVILEPVKTSKPIRFAYYQTEKARELAGKIAEDFGVKHLKLQAYRWNIERSPAVKVAIE